MSTNELIALYRTLPTNCPMCQRIVSRYERTLRLDAKDLQHLETCLIAA